MRVFDSSLLHELLQQGAYSVDKITGKKRREKSKLRTKHHLFIIQYLNNDFYIEEKIEKVEVSFATNRVI